MTFFLAFQAFGAISNPSIKWNKNTVTVCWQDNEPLDENLFTESQWIKLSSASQFLQNLALDQKILIQNKVQSEFNQDKTVIGFDGWKSCKETPDADAVLIVVNSTEHPLGRASLGRSEQLEESRGILPDGKKAFVFINVVEVANSSLNAESELEYTSLHEFGHLAGLYHENTHPQAFNDPNCTEDDLGPDFGMDGIDFLMPYDSSSIMNYCLYNFLSKTGLVFQAEKNGNVVNENNNNIFPFANFLVYTDYLIFKIENTESDILKVNARIGLSQNAIDGLRLLYGIDIKNLIE